jgi:hypothetical protein
MFYLTVFSSIEDLNLQNMRLQVVNLETGRLERTVDANKQGEVSLQQPLNFEKIGLTKDKLDNFDFTARNKFMFLIFFSNNEIASTHKLAFTIKLTRTYLQSVSPI